jgi:cob(I)alamin adenosyltransferase
MPPDIRETDISLLEDAMDAMDDQLPELKNFILPGGFPTVSLCHVCRTVCRRAERTAVALHALDPVEPLVLQYLNRLSDYFFLLARHIGHRAGAPEIVWTPRRG